MNLIAISECEPVIKAHFDKNREFTKYVKEIYEVTKMTPVGINLREIINKVLKEREEKALAAILKKNGRQSSKSANEKKPSAVSKQKPRSKRNCKPISNKDSQKKQSPVEHSYNLRKKKVLFK